jgi:hypothetical protein
MTYEREIFVTISSAARHAEKSSGVDQIADFRIVIQWQACKVLSGFAIGH